jgi:tetratricopeptide (TPR) repeat protein
MPANLPDLDALWNYDDPAATEQKFRDLLPEAEQSDDGCYHLQLMTQLARTLGLQRKFEEAHQVLDSIEPQFPDAEPVVKVRYLLERGRVLNSSGKPDMALPLFTQAWETARSAGEDFHAVDAAHMIAIVEPDPTQQLEWNHRALALAVQTSDERAKKWPASLYNNIGWTYHDSGDYAQALEHFEQALEWRRRQGNTSQILIAEWCIARALRSLGRLDEALAKQQDLLRQHEQAGIRDGYVLEELAECLYALNRQDEAKPYFAQAYAELSQDALLVSNESARLERLKALSANS